MMQINGFCYAIVDTITELVVMYFGAVNALDMRRFVRVNFSKYESEAIDGLRVYLVYDWKDPRSIELVGPVSDFVEPSSTMDPAEMRKRQIEEAQGSGAFRR